MSQPFAFRAGPVRAAACDAPASFSPVTAARDETPSRSGRKLNNNFKKAAKRLEKKKEEPAPLLVKGKKDKKMVMLEREFEVANRDLMALKTRSGLVTALIHVCTFFFLKSHYDGHAVARLPFEPFRFLHSVSHRNVPGSNMRDCSMVFVYMLCSMAIKPNLQRLLGHAPPKTATPAAAQKLAERITGTPLEHRS